MSTTFVPPAAPLKNNLDMQEVLDIVHDWHERAQGDEDKADEMENSFFYGGFVAACKSVEFLLTGVDHDKED